MKGQVKKSPTVHAEVSGSGRKLVQARLPFKVLSSPVDVPTVVSTNSESRKRKLSSDGDAIGPRKVLCTSEIKENLSNCKNDPVILLSDDETEEATKSSSNSPKGMNPVVKLSKIDDVIKDLTDEKGRIILTPKSPKSVRLLNTDTQPDSPTSSRIPSAGSKLLIKLPISEKKKRKLSQRVNSSLDTDSDVELISEELNPEKKVKAPDADQQEIEIFCNEKLEDSCSLPTQNLTRNRQETHKDHSTFEGNSQISHFPISKEELTQNPEEPKDISSTPKKKLSQNESEAEDYEKANSKASPTSKNKFEVSTVISDDEDSLQSHSIKDLNTEKNQKPGVTPSQEPQSEDESVLLEDDSDADSSTKSSQANKSENESVKDETSNKNSESDGNLPNKVLTPKQRKLQEIRQEKQKQKEAERLAKLKEKEEKQRVRQKEKEEKEEQKKREKEEKEEQRRKEKEEKEEQKRKEREEKEKKRLAELEAKNEEKRQKEEEKRIKEEERKKKEEEKKRKEEEAENKKRRAAEAFSKFFVQSKAPPKSLENDENALEGANMQNSKFVPFQIKRDMKLAPICRKCLDDVAKINLEKLLQSEDGEVPAKDLYLSCLKAGKISPGKDVKTLPACCLDEDTSGDCVVVDELEGAELEVDEANKPQKYRAKFLYFHENQRPPYYGTWRKKSNCVNPRRPFAQDNTHFDYEVDSDDEWEEEDPGESLHGSDDEKESEDEYDVDNEFMVPHGHLSDEELQNEDELEEDNSPEIQKEKLKILQAEFAREMKKKTEKIKPRIVGIVWQDENGNKPDLCSSSMWESLNKRAMIFTDPPVLEPPEKPDRESVTPEKKQPPKKAQFTEEHIKTLVQLVHGNRHKKEFMVKEFQAFISKETPETEEPLKFKKSSIKEQIERIAAWKVVVMDETKKKKRLCWMVASDILKQYDLESLGVVNKWEYTLQPKRILEETEKSSEIAPPTELESKTEENPDVISLKKKKKKKAHPAITKFTTIVSKEVEKKNTLNVVNCSDQSLENSQEENASKTVQHQKKSEEVLKSIPVNENPSTNSKPSPTQPLKKKKVSLLMSVPRGETISQEKKNALISEFLKKQQPTTEKDPSNSKNHTALAFTDVAERSSKPSPAGISPVQQNNPPQKKRVPLLMSVPRGQAIPEEKKSALISEYLKNQPGTDKDPPDTKEASKSTPMEVETVVLE